MSGGDKLNEICEEVSNYFHCPCYYDYDIVANGYVFKLETRSKVYFQSVGTNRIEALTVSFISALIVKELEQQMKVNKTFTVRILPFDMSINDKQLTFGDVSGIITGDYPKIEIQQASNPIKVTMIVPEGYYIVEDHT